MGYFDDPYSSPEQHGLTSVGELYDPELSYEFSILAVWRRVEDGALFWAADSGCSCPSPFEWAEGLADLKPVHDVAEFVREVRAWAQGQSIQRDAVERLVRKVRRLAKKQEDAA